MEKGVGTVGRVGQVEFDLEVPVEMENFRVEMVHQKHLGREEEETDYLDHPVEMECQFEKGHSVEKGYHQTLSGREKTAVRSSTDACR